MRCHSLAIHPTNRKETDPESREFLGNSVQGGHVAGALSILPIGIATIVSYWLACRGGYRYLRGCHLGGD